MNLFAPGDPALIAALRDPETKIPAGDMLENIEAHAELGHTVAFGGDQKGTVAFTGNADAALKLGIHANTAEALKAATAGPIS